MCVVQLLVQDAFAIEDYASLLRDCSVHLVDVGSSRSRRGGSIEKRLRFYSNEARHACFGDWVLLASAR
eukprot:2847305-Alexandrium_andersonii.AAC.1